MARPDQAFFRFATTGSSFDMNVDGSVTAVSFDIEATSGPVYINRCCVLISDGAMAPSKFGGLAALSEGLTIKAVDLDGTVLYDFLNGSSIKQNSEWSYLSGTDDIIIAAAGDDELRVRWTLSLGLGSALELYNGSALRFTVQDDLTGLTSFRIMGQGHV